MEEFVDCQRFYETGVCQGIVDETVMQAFGELAVIEYATKKPDGFPTIKIYGKDSSGNKQEGYVNGLDGTLYECYDVSTDNGFKICPADIRQFALNMKWECTWTVESNLN